MEIRWFGEPWPDAENPAAICSEKYRRVAAPVGRTCECGDPIEEGDRGVVTAAYGNLEGSYDDFIDGASRQVIAYHIDCFIGGVLPPQYRNVIPRRP